MSGKGVCAIWDNEVGYWGDVDKVGKKITLVGVRIFNAKEMGMKTYGKILETVDPKGFSFLGKQLAGLEGDNLLLVKKSVGKEVALVGDVDGDKVWVNSVKSVLRGKCLADTGSANVGKTELVNVSDALMKVLVSSNGKEVVVEGVEMPVGFSVDNVEVVEVIEDKVEKPGKAGKVEGPEKAEKAEKK